VNRVVLEEVRERLRVGQVVTATKSMALLFLAARMTWRPMRPNPLMPTLMPWFGILVSSEALSRPQSGRDRT